MLPFGSGLSYTAFEYDWCEQSRGEREDGVAEVSIASLARIHALERTQAALQWRVNVTNVGSAATGSMTSDVVLVLFASPAVPDPSLPLKTLVGFERVYSLGVGQTATVNLAVEARQLAYVNERGERWLRAGHEIVLGVDVPTKQLHRIRLVGKDTQLL